MKRLPAKEYARRRRNLMRQMGPGTIAIIPASPERIRNRDVEYRYRQDSDFLYLTGFNEPDAVAVLIPKREQGEFVLFCRERDPEQETWHGRRAGQEGAIERFAADDAFPIGDIDEILPGLLEHCAKVYYTMGKDPQFDRRLMDWINQLRRKVRTGVVAPHQFIDLEYLLHEMRLYKAKPETALMREAAAISVRAHQRAMRACRPGMYEFQVEAELLYEFRKANAEPAYTPIVGGGANGCILHYRENSDLLRDGDLLLIDAGAEYEGYASDITRTFPVNGRFTPAQRELYEIVLEAQNAAIAKAVPGNHWNDPHNAAVQVLTKGLKHLGLLQGSVTKLIKDGAYKQFYMHRTGHWLGMDVHDVGDYKVDDEWRLLEAGMTLTVEPGLYIPANSKGVDKRWWDIGIRIEDDVVITRDGNEVLTQALVRAPDDVERLMSESLA